MFSGRVISDLGEDVFIPTPVKEYPLIHFLRVADVDSNNYNPDVLTCLANLSSDEVFTPPQLVNQILDLLPQKSGAIRMPDFSIRSASRVYSCEKSPNG